MQGTGVQPRGLCFRETERHTSFLEPLRSTFLVNCKAHNLGPMEIIAGQWTLFTTDKKLGAYLYATILLHPMQSERVRMHNWTIALFKS